MQIDAARIEGNDLVLTVKGPESRRLVFSFKPGEYELIRAKKRRSNDANALCWKVCTEIANVLRSDKDSVYLEMLKRYGQSDIVSVLSSVDVSGYFKYYDVFGTGYTNGKEFTHYRVYKGSSEYDTREMSILLDGIIDEAKTMGIDVISEREKTLLLEEWGK